MERKKEEREARDAALKEQLKIEEEVVSTGLAHYTYVIREEVGRVGNI